MSILNTLPDGTQQARPALPRPTPPVGIHGATEPGYGDEDVRAVVTVRVAMTRDMLAATLDLACGQPGQDPDTWSVEYIRESVEQQLTYENVTELQVDAAGYCEFGLIDPTAMPLIQATYRAIDRAYPHCAPKVGT
ncbi:hypothetical protein [Streptomyces sp. NPDC091212]|uniref:hypothetical protein n=1 Tax=Streptomyces sp. NPDC091212 TaxID=3155191 RepID=UPI003443DDEF